MNVRFLPAASDDVVAATGWIDLHTGAGDAFDAAVRRAVSLVGATPQMYLRTEDGPEEPENREYYIARFECRVIYAIWRDEAVIVAVIHARHRPNSWQGRLADL